MKKKIENSQYDSNSNCFIKCSVKNCEDCSKDQNKCNKCASNYAIVNNDVYNCLLISSLGNNYFTNDTGIHYYSCEYKIKNCNTCTSNGNKCNQCFTGYYFLNQNYQKCYKETDLLNEYSNTIFKYNDKEYYSCDKGVNNCQTCLNGTYC